VTLFGSLDLGLLKRREKQGVATYHGVLLSLLIK